MSAARVEALPLRGRAAGAVVGDYLSLLKLRVVVLLVTTAVAAALLAAHGRPKPAVLFAVALGGAMAAGGAEAVNCWFDRDIDAVMRRTRCRPIPAGRIPAWHGLAVGTGLNAAGFVLLTTVANPLAATLALVGTLDYCLVYTVWLKRSTPLNIVIGGTAGAVPPLVGWAAVTGGLDLTALSLFAVIVLWTPPHFWALAQLLAADYRRAGIPMLPVVAPERSVRTRTIVYAVLTVVASVCPVVTGATGPVYLAGAMVLGGGFVAAAVLDRIRGTWTRRLFASSMLYLAGLFVLLASSALVEAGR